MPLPQGAAAGPLPASAIHDTIAAIAREAVYQRTIGESAWQRFWSALGRALRAISEFFRGSESGRHITLAIVVLAIAAIAIHFVLVSLAARGDVVTADTRPVRERAADARREAERLAAAGRFTDASHALLAALLAVFAQRGEVRLHSSKTAGDYEREIARRGSPARSAFRQFRRRYDAVIFGFGACDAEAYGALLRDAEPILSRAGAA